MTKKHFIALADAIKQHNYLAGVSGFNQFTPDQLVTLANFCNAQNFNFNASRWFGYIAGECGPSGGQASPARQRGNA